MAQKLLVGGWEQFGDTYRVFAEIPCLPDGSVNVAVLNATLLAITRINTDTFSPQPQPPLPVAHHATEAPMPPAVELCEGGDPASLLPRAAALGPF